MQERIVFYSALITFFVISSNINAQTNPGFNHRLKSTGRSRYGSSRRNGYTYQYQSYRSREHEGRYFGEYAGISFIPCTQRTSQLEITIPYSQGVSNFSYHDVSLITALSSTIPTYDFGIEYGNINKSFIGMKAYLINANVPNASYQHDGGVELSLGFNLRPSARFLIRPSLSLGTQSIQADFGKNIPNENLDDVILGTTFGYSSVSNSQTGHAHNVAVGLKEKTNYIKLGFEFNYALNPKADCSVWIFGNVGFCKPIAHHEQLEIYSDYHSLTVIPESQSISFTSQVPLHQLFDFSGISFSVGIALRLQ